MGMIRTGLGDIHDDIGAGSCRVVLCHILRTVRVLMARLDFPERLETALSRDNPIRFLNLAETPA